MQKFNKSWHLYVVKGDITDSGYVATENFSLGYPLTIDFNVSKNFSSYTNTAIFTIYGLNEQTRSKLAHNVVIDVDKFIQVIFTAGYNGNEYVVFKGRVMEAYSGKQGSQTEFRTTLTCDSLYNGFVNRVSGTYSAGTPYTTILEDVSKNMYGISFDKKLLDYYQNIQNLKSYSFDCSPMEVVQDLTNGHYYENNGIIYWLSGEIEDTNILKINENTGLLGTPIITKLALRGLNILFEPQIGMGSIVYYESSRPDFEKYNGIYKVMTVKHSGIISGGVKSSATTNLTLYTSEALKIQTIGDNNVSQTDNNDS